MQLLLVRHGEAEPASHDDRERSLTARGRQQVQQQLLEAPLPWQSFRRLWYSPYQRTVQTAELLYQRALEQGIRLQRQSLSLITPAGRCEAVQEWLIAQPDEALILVTHQPFVSHFIGYLTSSSAPVGTPMSPASMAMLTGEVVARASMELAWVRHP